MKKIVATLLSFIFFVNVSFANESLTIEKQLVGIVGAISGTVKTENRELKTGDKININESNVFSKSGTLMEFDPQVEIRKESQKIAENHKN